MIFSFNTLFAQFSILYKETNEQRTLLALQLSQLSRAHFYLFLCRMALHPHLQNTFNYRNGKPKYMSCSSWCPTETISLWLLEFICLVIRHLLAFFWIILLFMNEICLFLCQILISLVFLKNREKNILIFTSIYFSKIMSPGLISARNVLMDVIP